MFRKYPWSNIHELNLDWILNKTREASKIVKELKARFEEFLNSLPIKEMVKEEVEESLASGTSDLRVANLTATNTITGESLKVNSIDTSQITGRISDARSGVPANIDDYKIDTLCGIWYLVINDYITNNNTNLPVASGQGLLVVKKQADKMYRQVYITTAGSNKGIYTRYYSNNVWSDWTKFAEFSCKTTTISNSDAISIPSGEYYTDPTTTLTNVTPGKYIIQYSARFSANRDGMRGLSIKRSGDDASIIYSRIFLPPVQGSGKVTQFNGSYIITITNTCDLSLVLYQDSGSDLGVSYRTLRIARLEDTDPDRNTRSINLDEITEEI